MKFLSFLLTAFLLSGCVEQSSTSNQSPTQAQSRSQNSAPLPMATIPPSQTAAPIPVSEQKAPDCKISNIKIVPFDALKGEFGEEIKPNEDRGFFNEFGTSLFVVVEISSQAYFEGISIPEANKDIKVEIRAINGNKEQIAQKTKQIGRHLLMNGGKIFVPVWLDPLMCGDVKINAWITGQNTASTMHRTVPFECGE